MSPIRFAAFVLFALMASFAAEYHVAPNGNDENAGTTEAPFASLERARAAVLPGKCWSSPSFADGQLYVRSAVEGARLDLAGQ